MHITLRRLVYSTIIFVLAFIPPALAINSFFRYEAVASLVNARTLLPDFSLTSFLSLWNYTFYEYYRPGEYLIWWIGYLLIGKDPFLLHVILAVVYALIAVELYWIGRYFAGETAGWISALAYAFFEPVFILSWWTATLDTQIGILSFLMGLHLFLYVPLHKSVSILFSIGCFWLAIFTKEIYILLVFLLPGFFILEKSMRSGTRWIMALGAIAGGGLKIILQNMMGATAGDHIQLSPFQIDYTVALINYVDYCKLLIYGHNYYLVILCLLRPTIDEFKQPGKVAIKLMVVLGGVFVLRFLGQQWLVDVGIAGLVIYYAFRATYYERLWLVWIFLALSLVLMYDVRILGGIMSRRIMEPGLGFALIIGCTLSVYWSYYKQRLQYVSWSAWLQIKQFPALIWTYRDAALIILFLLIGFRQQWNSSGIRRELTYWKAEGIVLRDVIDTLGKSLPSDAMLYAEPPVGMQVISQIDDAMALLFDRRDILVLSLNNQNGSSPPEDRDRPAFVLLSRPITSNDLVDFQPEEQVTFQDQAGIVRKIYLYRLSEKL